MHEHGISGLKALNEVMMNATPDGTPRGGSVTKIHFFLEIMRKDLTGLSLLCRAHPVKAMNYR